MDERLSDDAHRALQLAREEARDLNHHWLGTEHLLLGLVRMITESSTAPGVEALCGLLRRTSEDAIRVKVTEAVGPIPEALTDGGSLTPRMNRILEQARKLAE